MQHLQSVAYTSHLSDFFSLNGTAFQEAMKVGGFVDIRDLANMCRFPRHLDMRELLREQREQKSMRI